MASIQIGEGKSGDPHATALRVLHVIPTIGPRSGGSSAACIELCRALAAKGVQVKLFTTEIDRPGADVQAGQGVEGQTGLEVRFFDKWGPDYYWFSPRMYRALVETIPQSDVVHIHSLYRSHLPMTTSLCRRFRVPYVLKPHGSLDPYLFSRRRWRKMPHEWLFEQPALEHAAAIHFTSEEERELAFSTSLFRRGIGYRDAVVPSGVVIAEGLRIENIGACANVFEKMPELRGKKLVLFFGRINFKKGLDILAQAFGLVLRQEPNAHLVIAGPDNEGLAKKVRRWLSDAGVSTQVSFTGMLLGEEKWGMLSAAHVFVLPSYTENFGIAVLESLSSRVPVVISNKVNIWREIQMADAGLVVNPDPVETATAILQLLRDDEARKKMGANGAALVEQKFTWESVADQMIELYERLRSTNVVTCAGSLV